MSDLKDGVATQTSGAERYERRCVSLLPVVPVVPAASVSGWMCPVTDVGQMAGVQEKNRDAGRGGGWGERKIAPHNNSPPERPCCCWRRKVVRAAAVSLVTESGEIMK